MSEMDEDEFTSMIETSPIKTSLMEFRDTNKKLIGVVLLDIKMMIYLQYIVFLTLS